jgi:hypothetical protein
VNRVEDGHHSCKSQTGEDYGLRFVLGIELRVAGQHPEVAKASG